MKKINFKQFLIAIATIIFFSTSISSCKKDDNNGGGSTTITTNAAIKLDSINLAYGSDATQKMDMYLPANRTDTGTKVLVMIHGGAWSAGDKSDFTSNIAALQNGLANYAIVNINYRLAVPPSTNLWPTQQTDVNAAIDFVIANANYYHYNANKIVLLGASAGAHLALLKAYKYNANKNIKVVVDYFGPTDMVDLYNFQTSNQLLITTFMNGTPTTNATAYSNASPLNFVTAAAPPTIIFHGTADAVVPIRESVGLDSVLQTAGVTHQYFSYAGEGHGVFNNTNTYDAAIKSLVFITANNK